MALLSSMTFRTAPKNRQAYPRFVWGAAIAAALFVAAACFTWGGPRGTGMAVWHSGTLAPDESGKAPPAAVQLTEDPSMAPQHGSAEVEGRRLAQPPPADAAAADANAALPTPAAEEASPVSQQQQPPPPQQEQHNDTAPASEPLIKDLETQIVQQQCSLEHRADVAAKVAAGGGPPVMFWGSCRLEGVSNFLHADATSLQQLQQRWQCHTSSPPHSHVPLTLAPHPSCSARGSLCQKPTITSVPRPVTSP